ncbi:MAG: J domain-containing protein [Veillonellaceae bacterium]|nr:J domain-containing protein [Veillonellaceae bacterium]
MPIPMQEKKPSWWRENWPYIAGLGLAAGSLIAAQGARRVFKGVRIPEYKFHTRAKYDAAGAGYARHAKGKTYTDPHAWYADWHRGKADFDYEHYKKWKATREKSWQDQSTRGRTYGGGATSGSRPGAGRTYAPPPPPPGGISEAEAFSRLGVKPGASPEEVRRAFRQKMYEAHPDRGGSHEQAVRVTEAWDAIKDKYAALVEYMSFKEAMERWTSA